MNTKIVTRFAPSPTGRFHVGSARSALFNYLYAQKVGGDFLLRVEDTDRERSKKEYEQDAVEALEWLGVAPTHALVRQSERTKLYKSYLEKMIDEESAYVSKEEKGERDEVIRFKNPNKEITFADEVRGEITFDTTELGDFVIAKSIDEPLYHLAVVVDDFEMGVTHVIRGEDHISNTPRQILIQEAFGAPRPTYVHLPLILGHDKSKLSKRHGATAVLDYRDEGYISDAFFNYLALLGWHPEGDEEIFSPEEIVEHFDLSGVQKGGAVFDAEKLRWVNRQHILRMDHKEHVRVIKEWLPEDIKIREQYSEERLERAASDIIERTFVWSDIEKMANAGEIEYFFEAPEYSLDDLLWKDDAPETTKRHLEWVNKTLKEIPEDQFDQEHAKSALWEYATEEGRGSVLWPLRFALSGRDRSPDPFVLCEILGKQETRVRVDYAIEKLTNSNA